MSPHPPHMQGGIFSLTSSPLSPVPPSEPRTQPSPPCLLRGEGGSLLCASPYRGRRASAPTDASLVSSSSTGALPSFDPDIAHCPRAPRAPCPDTRRPDFDSPPLIYMGGYSFDYDDKDPAAHLDASLISVRGESRSSSVTLLSSASPQHRDSFRLQQSAVMDTDSFGNTSVNGMVLWAELGAGSSATVFLGLDDDSSGGGASPAPPRAVKVIDRAVAKRMLAPAVARGSSMSPQRTAAVPSLSGSFLPMPAHFTAEGRVATPPMPSMSMLSREGFLATQLSLDAGDEEATSLAEVDVLGSLTRHPHIVTLHECIDDPAHDQVYLVMDLVPDGPVASIDAVTGRCDPLPLADVVRYGQHLAAALSHVHAHGIAHGDVKPDNLLVDRSKRHAFLADFGVARRLGSTDLDSSLNPAPRPPPVPPTHGAARPLQSECFPGCGCLGCSTGFDCSPLVEVITPFPGDEMAPLRARGHVMATTPLFAAPEVLQGRSPGPAADVWAMGVTLYALLLGRLPFVGSLRELAAAVEGGRVPLPLDGELDEAAARVFERVVLPLLVPAQEDRPTSAHVAHMLRELQADIEYTSTPVYSLY